MTKIMVLMNTYTPGQLDSRQSAVLAAASPGVEVDFAEVPESRGGGATTNFHRAAVAIAFARRAAAAEAAGYDAVVPWGTLDLGVEEARHVTDIPVIGPGRTATNVAASLVDRFGVMVYGADQVALFRKLLRSWGSESRTVGIRHVDLRPMEMEGRRVELRERFIAESRRFVDHDGAELILPLGFSMVPVTLSAAELTEELGVPVLDPLAIVMRVAEALATTGVRNSRAAYPHASLE
ncbi:MAG: aspartate/glutamate racemase family protein [Candidatus Limnocylindria bacterium]